MREEPRRGCIARGISIYELSNSAIHELSDAEIQDLFDKPCLESVVDEISWRGSY